MIRRTRKNRILKISGCMAVWVLAIVLLNGCAPQEASQKPAPDGKEKLSVVAAVFPVYDFVREVGGEYVSATLLLPPGMESHSFEPTPRDIMTIEASDLFLYVGGESDAWIETLLSGSDQVYSCRVMDYVDLRTEEQVDGMQMKGHHHDEDEAEYEEHIWTSPVNAMEMVRGICDELCGLDPDRKAVYEANRDAYLKKLQALDARLRETVQQGKRKVLLFGDRFPFLYLVKEYGLDYYAAFPGCNMETEPSAATLAFLTEKVRTERIPVILYLELSNHKVADALAESTGAQTRMFHSCHNVTKDEMEAGATYLELMETNCEVLQEALQ